MQLATQLISVVTLSLMTPAARAAPQLGVLLVFDQLRAVELDRYEGFFGPGGFGGLGGARFDAYYDYAGTETGPGHATLATGANPSEHGIALNTWYALAGDNYVKQYAVDDDNFPVFGAADHAGRSAAALLIPTLGDAMKFDSGGRAKVVTVSLKDRAAILTAGRSADLALWYDPAQGQFTSSTAYTPALPAWVATLSGGFVKRALAVPAWTALPIPAALQVLAPVDDRPGEGAHEGMGPTFPHALGGISEALGKKIYRLLPASMDDLVELALGAVDNMQLGADLEPDLLVVSFSTTDYVGHNYGPDSLEQLDTLRRADLAIRRLIAGLQRRVGARNMSVVLTSDHGASPPPLAISALTKTSGVVSYESVEAAAKRAIKRTLPKDARARVLYYSPPQLFLDLIGLTAADADAVCLQVAREVSAIDGVAHVYDLRAPGNHDDGYAPLMTNMRVEGRSAQLFVRTDARRIGLETDSTRGTDHGSVYTYDRRVPVIVSGPSVRRGRFAAVVDARDVAATLAFMMHVPPPDASQGKAIAAAFDP